MYAGDITMPDLRSELQEIELFNDFNSSSLDLLVEHCEVLELEANELLFEQGDEPEDCFFVVLTGEIGVRKFMRNDHEIVTRLKPGEYLGEFGLFSKQERMAGGIATEATRVLKVSRKALGKLKAETPESLVNLYEAMFDKLAGRFKSLAEKAEKTQFWL